MIDYVIRLGILTSINVILAASLNVINGYCGMLSMGHVGFFAVGAYAGAAFTSFGLSPEFVSSMPVVALAMACLVGMAAAALAGLLVGIPCLRLGGDYLAIATIGFSEIIRIGFLNTEAVGASRGLTGIAPLVNGGQGLIYALIAVAFTLLFIRNLMASSFGRCILAIREDEIAARSMGVNVWFYKTVSFVVGSMFAGLGGALFAHYMQFLAPNNFTFIFGVMILLMTVVGGIGSQLGSVLGAIIVTLLPELLRFNEHFSQIRMLLFGFIMVTVMLVQPNGLMGFFESGLSMAKRKNPKGEVAA